MMQHSFYGSHRHSALCLSQQTEPHPMLGRMHRVRLQFQIFKKEKAVENPETPPAPASSGETK